MYIHLGLQMCHLTTPKSGHELQIRPWGPWRYWEYLNKNSELVLEKGTWGLHVHSYIDLIDILSLEGTLSIRRFRGPGRRPQLPGYEASTVG